MSYNLRSEAATVATSFHHGLVVTATRRTSMLLGYLAVQICRSMLATMSVVMSMSCPHCLPPFIRLLVWKLTMPSAVDGDISFSFLELVGILKAVVVDLASKVAQRGIAC